MRVKYLSKTHVLLETSDLTLSRAQTRGQFFIDPKST